jgi:hypothetical protein
LGGLDVHRRARLGSVDPDKDGTFAVSLRAVSTWKWPSFKAAFELQAPELTESAHGLDSAEQDGLDPTVGPDEGAGAHRRPPVRPRAGGLEPQPAVGAVFVVEGRVRVLEVITPD